MTINDLTSIATGVDPATQRVGGFAYVNGLQLYYEAHGTGSPLIYIPPNLGHCGVLDNGRPHDEFADLAAIRRIIAVDVQGHGRTPDIPDRPLSIRENAEDIVSLMDALGIEKADLFGECSGGATAMLIASLYPYRVRRVATYGAAFWVGSHKPDLLAGLEKLTADDDAFAFQRESYERVAPEPAYWPQIWKKVCELEPYSFTIDELRAIRTPILIVAADNDWVKLSASVEAFEALPCARLAVIPDAGHFLLNVSPGKVVPLIREFMTDALEGPPFASILTGYQPGKTR